MRTKIKVNYVQKAEKTLMGYAIVFSVISFIAGVALLFSREAEFVLIGLGLIVISPFSWAFFGTLVNISRSLKYHIVKDEVVEEEETEDNGNI